MTVRVRDLSVVGDVVMAHVDDAAFLYAHRLRALARPGGEWSAADEVEARMERHLQGLRVAGLGGFELYRGLFGSEDSGEAFVAAVMAMRLESVGAKEALAEALAQGDAAPCRPALVDGLRFARDPDSENWIAHFLGAESAPVRAAAARAVGGRPSLAAKLSALIEDRDESVRLEARRAQLLLGRDAPAPPNGLQCDDPSLVPLALEVLVRLGDSRGIEFCRSLPDDADERVVVAALGLAAVSGDGPGARKTIEGVLKRRPHLAAPSWSALGLSADPGAIETMTRRLDAPWDLAEQWPELVALGQAATLLCGSELLPEFDPDEPHDEPFAAYREKAKASWKTPATRGGAPSRQAARGPLVRRGRPLSPAVLADDMVAPGHPRRDLVQLEMAVRFGCRVPWDVRGPFAEQARSAAAVAEWAAGADARFTPGQAALHRPGAH